MGKRVVIKDDKETQAMIVAMVVDQNEKDCEIEVINEIVHFRREMHLKKVN